MQTKFITKKINSEINFSKFKIDLKIFNKSGKIQTTKLINLSSILKKK